MIEDIKQLLVILGSKLLRTVEYILPAYPVLWLIDYAASKSSNPNAFLFYCDGTDWYWKPLVLGLITYFIFG